MTARGFVDLCVASFPSRSLRKIFFIFLFIAVHNS